MANREEPAFREWIRDGENGWTCPLDAESWSTAIRRLEALSPATMAAEAERIGRVASMDAVDQGYRAILEETVALPPNGELDIPSVLERSAA